MAILYQTVLSQGATGNSLGKRSFRANSNVRRGDEVESLLGASSFCRRVCRCEFSVFVDMGLKLGNLVVSYLFDSHIGAKPKLENLMVSAPA